jgi:hypothetical protein
MQTLLKFNVNLLNMGMDYSQLGIIETLLELFNVQLRNDAVLEMSILHSQPRQLLNNSLMRNNNSMHYEVQSSVQSAHNRIPGYYDAETSKSADFYFTGTPAPTTVTHNAEATCTPRDVRGLIPLHSTDNVSAFLASIDVIHSMPANQTRATSFFAAASLLGTSSVACAILVLTVSIAVNNGVTQDIHAQALNEAQRIAVISMLPSSLLIAANAFVYAAVSARFRIKKVDVIRNQIPVLLRRAQEAEAIAAGARDKGDMSVSVYAASLSRSIALAADEVRERLELNKPVIFCIPATAASFRAGILLALTVVSLGIRIIVLGSGQNSGITFGF